MNEPLYAGTHGHVVAVDAASGADLWRTKLGRGASFVSLAVSGDRIFAGHYGQCYCLNRAHGEILWHNNLPKTGYHMVLLADRTAPGRGGAACPSCEHVERADARYCSQCGAAIAATSSRARTEPLYATLNGHVLALERRTGRELWRHKMSRGHGCPVSLLFGAQRLYLGCAGHIQCVEGKGGHTVWTNDLPGLGYGVVTLLMAGVAGADPDQTTLAAFQKAQNDAAAASAGAS